MKNYKANKGFTLAETLIVVAVLGVIAMLTIPNLIRNQIEAQHRTKVKKSMTVYDLALSKIVLDNDIKNNSMLAQYAEEQKEANCEDSSKYFKKSKETSNGCIFMTSDKVWHNIEDIRRHVISFEEITPENKDEITANANTRANKKAFVLVGHFDDRTGALRVNDLNFEKNNPETVDGNSSYDQVSKNFDFINNKKDDEGGEVDSGGDNACEEQDFLCRFLQSDNMKNNCPSGDLYACMNSSMECYPSPVGTDCDFDFGGYAMDCTGSTLDTCESINFRVTECSDEDGDCNNEAWYSCSHPTSLNDCSLGSFMLKEDVTINGEEYTRESNCGSSSDDCDYNFYNNDNGIYLSGCDRDMNECYLCSGNTSDCENVGYDGCYSDYGVCCKSGSYWDDGVFGCVSN